ncbi:uncharacterized protein LOC111387641 [Olea europaea var. sylvestris]|uniref:uncharacterized protein LOC111387641 n=1 Tax=Olea europaea var. sylvestris TaxID=158386 RepID=UPI000C1CE3BF|nr:uncharacterized protein LOC111387641 [Olea europaea var. sylvestris]
MANEYVDSRLRLEVPRMLYNEQFRNLRRLLLCFETVSGLKIDLRKFEAIPVGEVANVDELANILDCRVAQLPMTYLGFPLGAKFKSKHIWNVERVEKMLAGWKRMYLSKGGHLTLIKSTLSNLPTYFLSLFPIPGTMENRLERIQREFLWAGLGEERKFHLINWSVVCSSIRMGALE